MCLLASLIKKLHLRWWFFSLNLRPSQLKKQNKSLMLHQPKCFKVYPFPIFIKFCNIQRLTQVCSGMLIKDSIWFAVFIAVIRTSTFFLSFWLTPAERTKVKLSWTFGCRKQQYAAILPPAGKIKDCFRPVKVWQRGTFSYQFQYASRF